MLFFPFPLLGIWFWFYMFFLVSQLGQFRGSVALRLASLLSKESITNSVRNPPKFHLPYQIFRLASLFSKGASPIQWEIHQNLTCPIKFSGLQACFQKRASPIQWEINQIFTCPIKISAARLNFAICSLCFEDMESSKVATTLLALFCDFFSASFFLSLESLPWKKKP